MTLTKQQEDEVAHLDQTVASAVIKFLENIGLTSGRLKTNWTFNKDKIRLIVDVPSLPFVQFKKSRRNKLQIAFASIPYEPTPLTQFLRDYGVSESALRQYKRFDKTGLDGKINLRAIDGVRSVWRDPLSTSLANRTLEDEALDV